LLCVALRVSIWLPLDESAIARRMQRLPNSFGAHVPFAKHEIKVTKPKNMSTWLT
jgi:hypothetical protein